MNSMDELTGVRKSCGLESKKSGYETWSTAYKLHYFWLIYLTKKVHFYHLHNGNDNRHFFLWGQKWENGASLVVQWLRICLLMQGTRVRALVWEDPTCHGVTGPVSHSCWACSSGACALQWRGRDSERPAHHDEEWPPHRNEERPPLAATRESPRTKWRPNIAKNKLNKLNK